MTTKKDATAKKQTTKAQYFSFLPEIMKFHGMYPSSKDDSIFYKIVTKLVALYSQVQHVLIVTFCVLYPSNVGNFKDNVGPMSFCIAWSLIFVNAYLNLVYQQYFRRKAKDIHRFVEERFHFSSDYNAGPEEYSMAYTIKIGRIITFSWHLVCHLVIFLVIINPMFSTERSLPIPAWFPYDWSVTHYYQLTFIFQSVGLVNLVYSYPTYDVFYAHCMTCSVAQLKILAINLKNTINIALLNYGLSKEDVNLFKMEFNGYGSDDLEALAIRANEITKQHKVRDIHRLFLEEKFNDVLMETFGKYINHYQMISEFCKKLNEFYGPALLIRLMYFTTSICFLAFSLLIIEDRPLMISILMCLLGAVTLALFVTSFGSSLYEANLSLLEALYEIPWYVCNQKFKTTFLIMQTRILNEPIKLLAGKVINIDLNLYLKIIKTAFSYYTLLRQMMEK